VAEREKTGGFQSISIGEVFYGLLFTGEILFRHEQDALAYAYRVAHYVVMYQSLVIIEKTCLLKRREIADAVRFLSIFSFETYDLYRGH